MRVPFVLMVVLLYGCDQGRVYEQQVDFKKAWMVSEQPQFDFEIIDYTQRYNIYFTVRNSLDFPFSRIFVSYTLNDSLGTELNKDLVSGYLFDQKTGAPFGRSGLGDLYDHRFPLLTNYQFERPGVYSITLEQFNRRDTLNGVLAVGTRVERVVKN